MILKIEKEGHRFWGGEDVPSVVNAERCGEIGKVCWDKGKKVIKVN